MRTSRRLRELTITGLIAWLVGLAWPAQASGEQFVPIFTGREIVGSAGAAMPAGMIDYLKMINIRDGGINGVRLTWAECETVFDDLRGVACFERLERWGNSEAAFVMPLSSGISYALTERTRQKRIPMLMLGYGRADASDGRVFPYAFPLVTNLLSQAAAQISFIGQREGGVKRLRGKQIVYLYLDIPTGREALALFEAESERHGFELIKFGVPLPGTDQQAIWQHIQRIAPDWILLAGPGLMTPAALKGASSVSFPVSQMIGFGLSGDEHDMLPAGDAAIGYIAMALNPSGMNFRAMRDIRRYVHSIDPSGAAPALVGTASYNRGVIMAIIIGEAIRVAQARFGNQPVSGEQVRWGLERLSIDEQRLSQLGALELLQPPSISCLDHEGGGAVKIQQWLGDRWIVISDWVSGDQALVRHLVEAAAARYAAQRAITPRDCGNE